jgi:hypothetical protein
VSADSVVRMTAADRYPQAGSGARFNGVEGQRDISG